MQLNSKSTITILQRPKEQPSGQGYYNFKKKGSPYNRKTRSKYFSSPTATSSSHQQQHIVDGATVYVVTQLYKSKFRDTPFIEKKEKAKDDKFYSHFYRQFTLEKKRLKLLASPNKQTEKPQKKFSLPNGYVILVTDDTNVADQWIYEHVLCKSDRLGIYAVGIDTEWDIIKPLDAQPCFHDDYQYQPDIFYAPSSPATSTSNSSSPSDLTFQQPTFCYSEYPDVIQIATETHALVYQTNEGKAPPCMNFYLLLTSNRIFKIWSSPSEDTIKIDNWFHRHGISKFKFSNKESHSSCGFIDIDPNCKGLATVCSSTLGLQLEKDSNIIISRWSRVKLSFEQQLYSTLDAFLNLVLYQNSSSKTPPASPTQPISHSSTETA